MTPAPRLLGAVLAGGEGRRFGGPKAGARAGGIALIERAVALLRQVVGEVVVVASHPRLSAAPVILDRVSGRGPLAGLDAALRHAAATGHDGVFLLACDLPLLTPAVAGEVVAGLGGHAAAAPAREGGGVEPLCAAYRVEVLAAVERRLDEEDRSLHALFREVGGHAIHVAAGGPASFLNVNTRNDLERAEAALANGGCR